MKYEQVAAHITPVPGGVGPMTIAMLMFNTVLAARRAHASGVDGLIAGEGGLSTESLASHSVLIRAVRADAESMQSDRVAVEEPLEIRLTGPALPAPGHHACGDDAHARRRWRARLRFSARGRYHPPARRCRGGRAAGYRSRMSSASSCAPGWRRPLSSSNATSMSARAAGCAARHRSRRSTRCRCCRSRARRASMRHCCERCLRDCARSSRALRRLAACTRSDCSVSMERSVLCLRGCRAAQRHG